MAYKYPICDVFHWFCKIARFFATEPNDGHGNPKEVTFTGESNSNPTSWSWDFGDGDTSTDQNPVHKYQKWGSDSVTLTTTYTYRDSVYTDTTTHVVDLSKK